MADSEWVILGRAEGQRGKVRIAFTETEEPDSRRKAEAKVAVLQNYRQVYYGGSRWDKEHRGEDDWPEVKLIVRDESNVARRTFA